MTEFSNFRFLLRNSIQIWLSCLETSFSALEIHKKFKKFCLPFGKSSMFFTFCTGNPVELFYFRYGFPMSSTNTLRTSVLFCYTLKLWTPMRKDLWQHWPVSLKFYTVLLHAACGNSIHCENKTNQQSSFDWFVMFTDRFPLCKKRQLFRARRCFDQ